MARILVVDDDPILRAIAEEILSAEGHDVTEAENGRAAIAAARAQPFDLVVTDILMPEVDGLELIRQLREAGSNVRILAVSSGGKYSSKDVLAWAKGVGADAVLHKPLQRARLIETVDLLLSPSASGRSESLHPHP